MISLQCASEVYQKAAKLSRTIWAVTSSAQFTGELCVFVSPVVVASRHRFWLKKEIVVTTIASLYWHKKKLPSTSTVKMAQAIFEEAKITNIEMKSHALLEIAPGIHSPVCPYLVEFSACVPPALHMGMTYDFHIGDLGFYKGSLSHFYQWSAWQLFFVSIQARNSSGSEVLTEKFWYFFGKKVGFFS